MFGSLKDKLKNWVSKNEEDEVTEEKEEKKRERKPKKEKAPKKTEKIVKKDSKKPKKEEKKKDKKNKDKENIQELRNSKKEEKKLEKEKLKEAKKKAKEDTLELRKTRASRAAKKEVVEIVDDIEETIEEIEDQIEDIEEKPKSSIFKKILTEEKLDEMFEELEMILLQNNVAYDAVDSIKNSLRGKLVGNSLKNINLSEELKNSIEELLINPPDFIKTIKESLKEKQPFVILFSGINGAGKTTSIAKIAHYLQKNKLTSCLAAADTFRAAAIQQLEEHANKLKVPIIKKDYGSDPASVGFDAIAYAKKHKIDVVLIDTAGRIQNKDTLMKEIEKISRVTSPDMKIFLGESITGNDATEQAKAFNESLDLTGIILSKADVDEKGGTAISVSAVTGRPILFLGTGQKYEDLEVFDKEKLIGKLGL